MTEHREEYIFANGYIGAHVKNLMSQNDLMRLATSKGDQGAEAVLQEFGYGEGKETHFNEDLEGFLRGEENSLYEMVLSSIPDREKLAMLLYPKDYHNVKVLLKTEFLGQEAKEEAMFTTGHFEPKQLAAMIRERNYIFMTPIMKNAIIEAVDLFSRGHDPQEIDIILDKACFTDMLIAAKETGDEFIIGYVRLQIDLLNLRTFARLREIKRPWAFFQKVFLEGGNIEDKIFINSYEEPYSQFADKVAPYGLKEVVSQGGAKLRETGKFTTFEKLSDDSLINYIKGAKYYSFGIAPIAAFLLAKDNELKMLRIVLGGRLANLTAEEIGERLRETYV